MRFAFISTLAVVVSGLAACQTTLVDDQNGGGGEGGGGEGGTASAPTGRPGKQYPADPPSYELGYYQWVLLSDGLATTGAIVDLEDGTFANVYLAEGSLTPQWSFGSDLDWSAPEPVPNVQLPYPDFDLHIFEDRGTLTLVAIGAERDGIVAVGSRSQMAVTDTPANLRSVTQHPDGSIYGLTVDDTVTPAKAALVHWVDGVGQPSDIDLAPLAEGCALAGGKLAFTSTGDLVTLLRCDPLEEMEWRASVHRDGAWLDAQTIVTYYLELAPHDATQPAVSAFFNANPEDEGLVFAPDTLDPENNRKGVDGTPIYTTGFVDPWGRPVYTRPGLPSENSVFIGDEGGWLGMQIAGEGPDFFPPTAAFQRTTGRPVFSAGSAVYVFQTTPQGP